MNDDFSHGLIVNKGGMGVIEEEEDDDVMSISAPTNLVLFTSHFVPPDTPISASAYCSSTAPSCSSQEATDDQRARSPATSRYDHADSLPMRGPQLATIAATYEAVEACLSPHRRQDLDELNSEDEDEDEDDELP